jgi:hypothetical protein
MARHRELLPQIEGDQKNIVWRAILFLELVLRVIQTEGTAA